MLIFCFIPIVRILLRRKVTLFFAYMQIILDYLLFFYLKRVVFLAEIAHHHSQQGDHHLAGRRIPPQRLDAEFEAEIVDSEIECDDADIAHKLPRAMQVGAGERHVLVQPETGQQGDREDDAQRRDMRGNRLLQL